VGQDAPVDRAGWLSLLDLREEEVPRLLVLEGTWWRQKALDSRLPMLRQARELGMPDLWHGWYGDIPVAYCPAYGASRAVEPVHVLGLLGTRNVVQIGSCGSLQPDLRTGDIVLSERATIGEGASQYYGGRTSPRPTWAGWRAQRRCSRPAATNVRAARLHRPRRCCSSRRSCCAGGPKTGTCRRHGDLRGLLAAAAFRMRAASLLFVWDELPQRSWTDAFTEQEEQAQAALRRGGLRGRAPAGLMQQRLAAQPALDVVADHVAVVPHDVQARRPGAG
jgi:hypothetical protein